MVQPSGVLVFGAGISGRAVVRYYAHRGVSVSLVDEASVPEDLASMVDGRVVVGRGQGLPSLREILQRLRGSIDQLVISPGIGWNHPLVEQARNLGLALTSEVELALARLDEPLVAITGTNGKTTTTHLIGQILYHLGVEAYVGGNEGHPLLEYVHRRDQGQTAASVIVAELSSYQLENLRGLRPRIAVFTNLEPDHLDRYADFAAYGQAKKNLALACSPQTVLISNDQCDALQDLLLDVLAQRQWFRHGAPASGSPFCGIYTQPEVDPRLGCVEWTHGQQVAHYDLHDFPLTGAHNQENLMAAILAVRALGHSAVEIQRVIGKLRPTPHRLEWVREHRGVCYFNDSKATNVASVRRSLESFAAGSVILIAGGKDKGLDYGAISTSITRSCKLLILLGAAKYRIERALGHCVPTYLVDNLAQAVEIAYQRAGQGEVVLLSPMCASLDQFRNYEERGDIFKQLVRALV